jgi:hypothetical protein
LRKLSFFYCVSTFLFLFISVKAQLSKTTQQSVISLAGTWAFQIDAGNKGIIERWFSKSLSDQIKLPGSMLTNGKGDEVTANTKWTGGVWDSIWYNDTYFAKYRQPGNVKISFWLQPLKHYIGPAWYQKKVTVPAHWKQRNISLFLERCHWETMLWIDDQYAGTYNALGTPHQYPVSKLLTPGLHTITLRIDNTIKGINPGLDAHSISDNTQTNWNGIIGAMQLVSRPLLYIGDVQLYPDVAKKLVHAKIIVCNKSGATQTAMLRISATEKKRKLLAGNIVQQNYRIDKDSTVIEMDYNMGASPLFWDEFNPNCYSFQTAINSKTGNDVHTATFGMKNFSIRGTQFIVNGSPIFLRGTLECAIFPKTGFPPTDVASWKYVFQRCKDYGLNHVRFHSWTPPEAAFDAADEMGMYLSIEPSAWTDVGDGKPIDQYVYDESIRVVQTFGNHPSFCMMPYGNEARGKNAVPYLTRFIQFWQARDNRILYTSTSGFPVSPAGDYTSTHRPRIQQWNANLTSIINANSPTTDYDWLKQIEKNKPTVSHEIGQWCVYPDFKEMVRYDGVLKPKNFEIFQTRLQENGMAALANDFLMASGKLQVLCYKADIEAALRTSNFAGFQLLDLHDFPGQGTALVGVLDPFWNDKGYVSANEYRQFCNTVVPLARMPKLIYENTDSFFTKIHVANFSNAPLKTTVKWKISDTTGKILFNGAFKPAIIPIGNTDFRDSVRLPLSTITNSSHLILTVTADSFENKWDFFVYPAFNPMLDNEESLFLTDTLTEKALQVLNGGGKVLFSPKKGSLNNQHGGDIKIGFSSIFWNTSWTNKQAPHTLGILCNPAHPALQAFPTQYHSNYQWWDAMSNSNPILLDSVALGLQPIVRVIDDWMTARSLSLLFECKVGNGKMLVSGIDLLQRNKHRPEARQLLYSLKKYMLSEKFQPSVTVAWPVIKKLYK